MEERCLLIHKIKGFFWIFIKFSLEYEKKNSMSRKEKKKKAHFPSSRNVSTKIYTNGPPSVDKNRAVKVEAERGNISRRGGTWYESPPPSCITEIARKILATRRSKIGGGGKKEKEKRKRKEKKRERNAAKLRQILPQQHRVSRPNKIEGFTTRSADPDTPFLPPPPMPLPSPRIFHDSL